MKILVVVSKAALGGHILSAFTIAKYLKKRGHTVIFAGGRGGLSTVIEKELSFIEVPFPMWHGSRVSYFTWSSFPVVGQLRKIIQQYDFDIIHAFDARAYIHTSMAALYEGKPNCCTLCGGIDPLYNIPIAAKIVVFSEEQRQKMQKQYSWKPERVEIIRTRVDVDKAISDDSPLPIDLPLIADVPSFMMISSFDGTKSLSIMQVIDALEILLEDHVLFQMIFIGGKGVFFEEMKQRAASINEKWHRQVITLTGPVVDAYKLLKKATIVLGVGRSAFEGMVFAKPTMVVGENGYAGLVSEQTVDAIGYYNFSGRNQKKLSSPKLLACELTNLLSDSEKQKLVGAFGQQFVLHEIDIKAGISRIEKLYEYNVASNTSVFRLGQWLSVLKIMVPIWRDNWWHTIGMPLKRIVRIIARNNKVQL